MKYLKNLHTKIHIPGITIIIYGHYCEINQLIGSGI